MSNKFIDQTLEVINCAIKNEASHVTMEDSMFNGNNIKYNNTELKGFIFCDYIGLSTDKRLKEASKQAIDKYGVFTSVSRTFIKLGLYDELEEIVSKIFNKPVILITRTSLGHIAALPLLVQPDDVIILDHFVHTSVRNASDMLRGRGNHIEILRHNNLEKLEQRIIELRKNHKKIWYLADGVYSMHGDTIPGKAILELLNKYEEFHVYVDDAHGMSWTGVHGCGSILGQIPYHPRLFVITSFAKGFGTGGCAIVCPDQSTKDFILKCGAPLIFSGPIAPPTLGAIKASAEIHLSSEIYLKQKRLRDLIIYFQNQAQIKKIPIVGNDITPIKFVPNGKPDMCAELCGIMKTHGFFVTGGGFPAVPFNNSGMRVVLSVYHSESDIDNFLDALKYEIDNALLSRNMTMEELLKHYKEEIVI